MKIEFLKNEQILGKIKWMVANKRLFNKPLRIAVAYWGKQSLTKTGLIKRIISNPDRIQIICDLTSGSCNPNPIDRLRKFKVETRTQDDMHAKVWMCGDHVILGSANVSSNGLGFDDAKSLMKNHEAAIYINDKSFAKEVHEWFDELRRSSKLVNAEHVRWAKENWETRVKNIALFRGVSSSVTLLSRLRDKGVDNEFKNVRVLAWEESGDDRSKEVQKLLGDRSEAQEYYTEAEWNSENNRDLYDCAHKKWKFVKDQIFLDFVRDPQSKEIRYTGIVRIVSPNNHYIKKGNRYVIMLHKESSCNGYILTKPESKELIMLIERHIETQGVKNIDSKVGNLLEMSITEFVRS